MKMRAAWKIWGILLLLLCLGITAAQADSFNLSFSWDADGTELSVRLYQQKKDYVLFLPGCAPADSLTVTLQGRQEIRWKDAVIRSVPLGFEPKTHSLEGCCSIQLSYGTVPSPGRGVQIYAIFPD